MIKIIESFLIINDDRSIIERYGADYGTTLYTASAGGYDKVMQMLLDKGVDINTQDEDYGNDGQETSNYSEHKLVMIILDKSVDINAQGEDYGNELKATSN